MKQKDRKLVIRRGQTFKIKLTLNRPYVKDEDSLNFIFTVDGAKDPKEQTGTFVSCELKNDTNELSADGSAWGCGIESIDENDLIILIKTAAKTTIIGKWRIHIDISAKDEDGVRSFDYPHAIYIIFNPWCKNDEVFMDDTKALDEYVLGESTMIWSGSHKKMTKVAWKVGQFEENVLDCALFLLTKTKNYEKLDNPVSMSRLLSALVNSNDQDSGVLHGNWSGKYSGGKSPSSWVGSDTILKQYYESKEPVKFGQCWVFAGVLTTVLRALGIMSRVVTNFESGHPSKGVLVLKYFFDAKGNALKKHNTGSIWNFHVWSEAWMLRPDIGNEFSGWQAVDGTPQEKSEKIFQCGPAPVKAIKIGEVKRNYDTDFLYAEVNADKMFFRFSEDDKKPTLYKEDTVTVGKSISTKAIGSFQRQDLTNEYKHQENTKEERETMEKALKALEQDTTEYRRDPQRRTDTSLIDYTFTIPDTAKIGQDFEVILEMKNLSKDTSYSVSGLFAVNSVNYTRTLTQGVKTQEYIYEIPANESKTVVLSVTFHDYYKKLLDKAAFQVISISKIKEQNEDLFKEDIFILEKPEIEITLKRRVTFEIVVSMKNPFPLSLHNARFLVEAPAFKFEKKVGKILKDGTAEAICSFTPPADTTGSCVVVAKFISDELDDCNGYLEFEV